MKNSKPPRERSSSDGLIQTFAVSVLALLIGLAVIFIATDRGHAFTTEALRRSEVARAPQRIPDFPLLDPHGQHTTLHQLLAADGRVWIVDFVYTRCQTICTSLGSVYQQLQQQMLARDVQDKVGLLSISFDPSNDDAAALQAYATRMRMNPAAWNIATLSRAQDRRRLLDAFGIMVVPAPLGEFEHNAALHIVDAQGWLLQIMDYNAPGQAIDLALATRS